MSNRDEYYENNNLGWPDKENWQGLRLGGQGREA